MESGEDQKADIILIYQEKRSLRTKRSRDNIDNCQFPYRSSIKSELFEFGLNQYIL